MKAVKPDTGAVDAFRDPFQEAVVSVALRRTCSCGHDKPAHSHYRRGSDCSGCGCTGYVRSFVLTLSFRAAPAMAVVVPDEVPLAAGPYVRPTHTAGTGGRARLEVPLVLPRTSEPAQPPRVSARH